MLDREKNELDYTFGHSYEKEESKVLDAKDEKNLKTSGKVKLEGAFANISVINIRRNPALVSDILAQLPNGAKVDVIGSDGEFYIVELENGTIGYCKKSRIELD